MPTQSTEPGCCNYSNKIFGLLFQLLAKLCSYVPWNGEACKHRGCLDWNCAAGSTTRLHVQGPECRTIWQLMTLRQSPDTVKHADGFATTVPLTALLNSVNCGALLR